VSGLEYFKVGHTSDGSVVLSTGGFLDFVPAFERIITADDADALAAMLAAEAGAARQILAAEAKRIADERELAELRIVGYIPMSVPPATARLVAQRLLAAFDITPKDEPRAADEPS
jgi:hypothetical protein